ncbi:hypothetical protein HYDPIDRAFT_169234 [Hydnomerulius pinastri MD-312]|uniref:DUF6533 domain-containing protein n=1 Tax=Hydnomerulius pinastri MD-312 TaxID=994086 RepID=A0A0C9WCP9_9AGAM|nr:hypothetical protein HYDPIDRAFT_169234 [Hydnomerulius pinastri MD-312]
MSGLSEADYANVVWITRACQTSASIAILYDHGTVITFGDETKYIWTEDNVSGFTQHSPLSLGTILYYIIRYVGDAVAMYSRLVSTTAAEPSDLVSDASCLVQAVTVAGAITCMFEQGPSGRYHFWLPIIGYEGILFSLALWFGFKRYTSRNRFRGSPRVSIVDALVQGNVISFFCVLVPCIVSAVMWQTLSVDWMDVPEYFPATMEVVMGCRLILSLRSEMIRTTLPGSQHSLSMWTVDLSNRD